jgi:CRISPR-associated endonuclease/helicase Cas3
LKAEDLSKLPEISIAADVTNRIVLETPDDLMGVSTMNRYYDEYFFKNQGKMDYPLKNGGSIYDWLSKNCQGRGVLQNRTGKPPPGFVTAFASAGESFSVIDTITQGVVVPYGKGKEYIEAFSHASLAERRTLLRLMGRYSVSLYPYEISRLEKEHALMHIAEDVLTLEERFYDDRRGVIFSAAMPFLGV